MVNLDLEQHGGIYGASSSGKTYLAKTLFRQTKKRAIYWNRQEETIPGVPEVRNWDVRLLYRPGAKVNLIPPESVEESRALLTRVKDDLFRIGKHLPNDRRGWVVFFHDEPDKESPAWDKESGAYEIAVRGNRHCVKLVAITQAPSQFSLSARKQFQWRIIFRLDDEETAFMRKAGVPDDVIQHVAWTSTPEGPKPSYRFAYNGGAGWVKCQPYKVA